MSFLSFLDLRLYWNLALCMYVCVCFRVVTEFAKYRDISDYGLFRPFIVSESTFHADQFGIDGI